MIKKILIQLITFIFIKVRYLKKAKINKDNINFEMLTKNGYVVIKGVFSRDECKKIIAESGIKEDFYKKISTPEYVKLSKNLESIIYKKLISKKIINLVLDYLVIGKNKLAVYGESFLVMPKAELKDGSQLPHHDSKYNRLKIYLWLTEKSEDVHPLYYLEGSHHSLKLWKNYNETRYPNITKDMMKSIIPEMGDVVLFDTNGIHSNTKEKNKNRIVFTNSMDYCGLGGTSKYYAETLNAKIINASDMNLLSLPD